jgi:hypothetical protein
LAVEALLVMNSRREMWMQLWNPSLLLWPNEKIPSAFSIRHLDDQTKGRGKFSLARFGSPPLLIKRFLVICL